MKITVKEVKQVEVKFLQAYCGVRYWEDARVNGIEDDDGALIPCRSRIGDTWEPLINLETGTILNWPRGVVADIHYKVCDEGVYQLLDENRNIVKQIEGYVPAIMCPEGSGYGDYVIMKIDTQGKIANWVVNLLAFDDDWRNENT